MTPDPATRARSIVDVWERTSWYGEPPQSWMTPEEKEGLVSAIAAALAERDAALEKARADEREQAEARRRSRWRFTAKGARR